MSVERALAAAVVVVTHNSSHAILGWLEALEQLDAELELCVVDSGSTAQEVAFLREQVAPRVASLEVLPNVGFGRACNAGAEASTAPVLVFTNPDTRIRSLPSAVQAGEPVDGAVLAAMARESDGTFLPLAFEHLPSLRWEARNLLLGRHTDVYQRTTVDPAWALGAALVITRSDFDRIGGFSHDFFMYFEDADLCARHVERGGRVRLDTTFVVEHDGAGSSQPADYDPLEGIARQSGRIFAARHGGRSHALALYALLVCWYVPRRVAIVTLRRLLGRTPPTSLRMLVAGILLPNRVRRRMGVSSCASGSSPTR